MVGGDCLCQEEETEDQDGAIHHGELPDTCSDGARLS